MAREETHPDASREPFGKQSFVAAARISIVSGVALLTWWTWAHWGDIQIDCGRELYVPMEVLRGKLVYRDFWYPYGPLVPYLEALLVATFGKHLAVFYLFGAAITVLAALLMFEVGRMLDGIAVGLVAAFGLILQGFEPWAFNFIFPYSYAATVGLALGLLSVFSTVRYVTIRARMDLVIAAVAAGLALRCKQEVGLAAFVMIGSVIIVDALREKSVSRLLEGILLCLPGAALPAIGYCYLFSKLGLGFVLENWLGPPGPYFAEKYGKTLYAGIGMRFSPPEIAGLILGAAVALRLWYWLARYSTRRDARTVLALLVVVPLVVRGFTGGEPWSRADVWYFATVLLEVLVYPRGMYFVALGYLFYLGWRQYRRGYDARLMGRVAVCVFALALAVRVLAQVTPLGYSIYYGVSLFLIYILVLSDVFASASAGEPQRAPAIRAQLFLVEALIIAILLVPFHQWRNTRLNTSWGGIYLTSRDAASVTKLVGLIEQQKQSGKRTIIVPEAPFLYALTATEAVGRWYTLLPGFLSRQEEMSYIDDLARERPDFVIVTARNFQEYGAPRFGVDFDQILFDWIERNYRVIGQVGKPLSGSGEPFGADIYQRLPDPNRKSNSGTDVHSRTGGV